MATAFANATRKTTARSELAVLDSFVGSLNALNWSWLASPLVFKVALTISIVSCVSLLRAIVLSRVRRRNDAISIFHRWRQLTFWFALLVLAPTVAVVWSGELRQFAAGLGLASAGLVVALKDPIMNGVGWLFITTRRPFVLGDRVELEGRRGDVADIRLFDFSLMEIGAWVKGDDHTGRVIRVPNRYVLFSNITCYPRGGSAWVWNEIRVPISFTSNWQGAKMLLERIVAAHVADTGAVFPVATGWPSESAELAAVPNGPRPRVFSRVARNGVEFTIRYPCRHDARRSTSQLLFETILRTLESHDDIEIAYPTIRIYDASFEASRGNRTSAPPPTLE